MAILKGFPPSNTISPSVRITEKDYTYLPTAAGVAFNNAGLVGFASKGPFNVPTALTNLAGVRRTFGNPHPTSTTPPWMLYAAEQILKTANIVYLSRVGVTDVVDQYVATTASVDIYPSGDLIKVVGSPTAPIAFPLVNTQSYYFRWSLNGVESIKTLVLLPYTLGAINKASGYASIQEIVDNLNDQLDSTVDGIQFYVSGSNAALKTTWAYGPSAKIELLGVSNSLVGGTNNISSEPFNNILGLGNSMTQAQYTGKTYGYPSTTLVPTPTSWDFSSFAASEMYLEVVLSGTDNDTIDYQVQQVDLVGLTTGESALGVVNQINLKKKFGGASGEVVPGGFTAVVGNDGSGNIIVLKSTCYGKNIRINVKNDNGMALALGLYYTDSSGNKVYTIQTGTSPEGVSTSTGYDWGVITGPTTGSTTATFTVTADSAGVEGNETAVVVKNYDGGTFSISVYNMGDQVEVFGNLTMDSTSRYYVANYVNALSDYIRIVDKGTQSPPADSPNTGMILTGGSDGVPVDSDDQAALIIGNPVANSGLYAYAEPEQIDIGLIAAPGFSSTDVVLKLIDVAENYRQDCLVIIDPPSGFTPKEITAWQNGGSPLNSDKFDSDFAALYWPWVKIRDTYNQIDMWVPPSGSVIATMINSDNIGSPWLAPAGLTRGQVPGIFDVQYKPNLEERDSMYGARNAINPIILFPDVGQYVIWGQKTLQRVPSALDRVNVRRMMFYIEKSIKLDSRFLIFEPNTDAVRSTFISLARNVLASVQQASGIYDFFIQCDETLNTPDVIDRNELRARIGVQPTRAIEFIFIEFSLHRTGSFTQNTESV